MRNWRALIGSIAGIGMRATRDLACVSFFVGIMALLGVPARPDMFVALLETMIYL